MPMLATALCPTALTASPLPRYAAQAGKRAKPAVTRESQRSIGQPVGGHGCGM